MSVRFYYSDVKIYIRLKNIKGLKLLEGEINRFRLHQKHYL